MWNTNALDPWQKALNRYWALVKQSNLALEKEMEELDVETVRVMNPEEWYRFLLEKYFRWKKKSRLFGTGVSTALRANGHLIQRREG